MSCFAKACKARICMSPCPSLTTLSTQRSRMRNCLAKHAPLLTSCMACMLHSWCHCYQGKPCYVDSCLPAADGMMLQPLARFTYCCHAAAAAAVQGCSWRRCCWRERAGAAVRRNTHRGTAGALPAGVCLWMGVGAARCIGAACVPVSE